MYFRSYRGKTKRGAKIAPPGLNRVNQSTTFVTFDTQNFDEEFTPLTKDQSVNATVKTVDKCVGREVLLSLLGRSLIL